MGKYCFSEHGQPCALATFVDNLVVPACSPQRAIAVQKDIETYLAAHWGLLIGPDSKELLACKATTHAAPAGADTDWKVCQSMKTLGPHLDADGGIQACFGTTIGSMRRCFFANLAAGLRNTSEKKGRLRFLKTCVVPIAQSRWARWPY